MVGGNRALAAYDGAMRVKWRASTCTAANARNARTAAATSTATTGSRWSRRPRTLAQGSQVFVFDASAPRAAGWPRYNASNADFDGIGSHRYGAYGETVAVGQVDRDAQLEVVVTFDNPRINLFNHDRTSVLAWPWFTNRRNIRRTGSLGAVHPLAESEGQERPLPPARRRAAASEPPGVPPVDRLAACDRRPRPRSPQRGDRTPERREERAVRDAAYAFMMLDGGARRHEGFRRLPLTGRPISSDLLRQAGSGSDDREPRRHPPTPRSSPGARRSQSTRSGRRTKAVAATTSRATRPDVRLRGGRRRPRPRPSPRADHGTYSRRPEQRPARRALPPGAAGCTTSDCAIRAPMATASASLPRPRSRTSTATGGSRSWSRPSTTASTSTASRARTRSTCSGRRAAATCCGTDASGSSSRRTTPPRPASASSAVRTPPRCSPATRSQPRT